jgi:hypothetical protein
VADIARTDSNVAGTTNLVSDNPMSVYTSDLNKPTNKYEHVGDAKNRRDKGEHDMKQKHQAERGQKWKGLQGEDEGDSRYKPSGPPCVGARRLGKLDVVDCWAGRCTHHPTKGMSSV